MKAYLINMHQLVPRSRSSAKVKVKYKGYISQKMAVSRAFGFHKHILLFFLFFFPVRPMSATARAVEDKVFSLIKASIQSDAEDSGML